MAVSEASWRLTCWDIANGGGTAIVVLKSGETFMGRVDKALSANEILFLRTRKNNPDYSAGLSNAKTLKGWVTIDWEEIAAIEGEPCRS